MRDVVNLDAIKVDIKSEQAFQKRIRTAFYVIGALIVVGLFHFFIRQNALASDITIKIHNLLLIRCGCCFQPL